MKKILAIALMLCCATAQGGTYTITTNAGTDNFLQAWCFARNAALGGTLFTQPATPSGITVAFAKICMRVVIQADANSLSNQIFQSGFVPPTFTQWD